MSTGAVAVPVVRLPHAEGLALPAYATQGSAGLDLVAAILDPLILPPLGREPVPTGLAIALPEGYEAQIRPRSGWALSHGVTVLNAPGTIDCDYRGEIKVLLVNFGASPATIERGDRIAQLVLAPVSRLAWAPAADLSRSDRGAGGFGSTGRQG